MPSDLNTAVRDTNTEPIAAHLAILPPPYLWLTHDTLTRNKCASISTLENDTITIDKYVTMNTMKQE